MAPRSTRRKIRDHGERILGDINNIYEHFRSMEALAQGRSAYLTENIPELVAAVGHLEAVITVFTKGL